MNVKIVNVGKNPTPKYAHTGDAGFDLKADFSDPNNIKAHLGEWDEESKEFVLFPGGRAAIPTGIKMQLTKGYELQIRPRSGLSINYGAVVILGTVDSNYRGEIKVIIYNFSDEAFTIKQGDRIAQGVVSKFTEVDFKEVKELDESERGENGFGSSGIQ